MPKKSHVDPSVSSGTSPTLVVHPNDQYLHDIPTAAKLLSTTVFAVRTLMRTGELIYVAIGHRWLVSPQAIQDFIRRAEEKTRAAS